MWHMDHMEHLHELGNEESGGNGGNVFQYLLNSDLKKHVLLWVACSCKNKDH